MKYTNFENLPIWKNSLAVTKLIYDYSSKQSFSKDFGLKDQIRRAIVSVSSNIVEGFEKSNNNEFVRFLKIAKGSTGEVRNQLHVALLVEYISREEFDVANKMLIKLGAGIGGFIKYLENFKKTQSEIRNSK